MAAKRYQSWQLVLANLSGILYTMFVVFGATLLNTLHTCPTLYGYDGCYWIYWQAVVIVAEIVVNIVLFHYYNVRNQVCYWTVKSSSFVLDQYQSDAMARFGKPRTAAYYSNGDRAQRSLLMEAEHGQFEDERQGLVRSEHPPAISTPSSEHSSPRHKPQSVPQNGRFVHQPDGTYAREVWFSQEEMNDQGPTKFCVDCNTVTPRRSHHCPICQICVLRKDHHCFMTGGCVGLANQRYFIVFTFWAAIGSAYAAWFNFQYLDKFIMPWYPFGWLYYVGPIALGRWFLGYQSFFNMFLGLMWSISTASAFACLGFFGSQIFYTANGYTMHDYHVNRLKHNLEGDGETWSERFALVFGRRWWLNFIVPQFWLPNQMTPAISRNIFLNVSKDL